MSNWHGIHIEENTIQPIGNGSSPIPKEMFDVLWGEEIAKKIETIKGTPCFSAMTQEPGFIHNWVQETVRKIVEATNE